MIGPMTRECPWPGSRVRRFKRHLRLEWLSMIVKGSRGALVAALVGLTVAHCSGTPTNCTTNADCGSNEVCEYKIGSCTAHGQCSAMPTGTVCSFIETEYCGCDGSIVHNGCGYQNGYASGPTTGNSSLPCGDGGSVAQDGGQDGTATDGPGVDSAGDATQE